MAKAQVRGDANERRGSEAPMTQRVRADDKEGMAKRDDKEGMATRGRIDFFWWS